MVASAHGGPNTGFLGLYVGVWGARPREKYEIRYPAVPDGQFSLKTTNQVLLKKNKTFSHSEVAGAHEDSNTGFGGLYVGVGYVRV